MLASAAERDDGDILPHASGLLEEFADLKSKSGDVVGELERERQELRRYRGNDKSFIASVFIILPFADH